MCFPTRLSPFKNLFFNGSFISTIPRFVNTSMVLANDTENSWNTQYDYLLFAV